MLPSLVLSWQISLLLRHSSDLTPQVLSSGNTPLNIFAFLSSCLKRSDQNRPTPHNLIGGQSMETTFYPPQPVVPGSSSLPGHSAPDNPTRPSPRTFCRRLSETKRGILPLVPINNLNFSSLNLQKLIPDPGC